MDIEKLMAQMKAERANGAVGDSKSDDSTSSDGIPELDVRQSSRLLSLIHLAPAKRITLIPIIHWFTRSLSSLHQLLQNLLPKQPRPEGGLLFKEEEIMQGAPCLN
jgi:hypothetical protein